MGALALVQRTTSGEITTAGRPIMVHTVTLTAAAANATCDLKTGGTSGTTQLSLSAIIGTSHTVYYPGGAVFQAGAWATLGGAGAVVSVAFG